MRPITTRRLPRLTFPTPIAWAAAPLLAAALGCGATGGAASTSEALTARASNADASADAPGPDFVWPPGGWQTETIPFPLPFAPDLSYRGVEELRFPPGFMKTSSPEYWSYAFAWALDAKAGVGDGDEDKELEAALVSYFKGLCESAGEGKFTFDPNHFEARLSDQGTGWDDAHGWVRTLRGTVESYDPFVTGKPIRLNVEIQRFDCSCSKTPNTTLLLISPQAPSASVWTALRAKRDAFSCR